MTHKEASQLINKADLAQGGTWAELGAGTGTFTRVLAEMIGETGIIIALDQDKEALKWLESDEQFANQIIPHITDFTRFSDFPPLDGILMANSLHFVSRPLAFLSQLLRHLRPGGNFILVEYDTEIGNPWVPYPISARTFQNMASDLGLTVPIRLGRIQSSYGNRFIYAELTSKPFPD